MTGQRTEPWRDAIRATGASITQIATLAGDLADLDAGHLESLLQEFAADGEEQALSRLLQVCAYNAVKLDPTILCGCLGVCESIFDAAPCFALQDEHAVAPLLRAAAEPALSLERNCFAVRLAAELTRKFVLDPQPVRKALWKVEQAARTPELRLLLTQVRLILEEASSNGPTAIARLSELTLADVLPAAPPANVIGGHYTVRRPIAKLGRNDPCHCGSGKKYKKCCYTQDQALLRDASAYAGTTWTDLKSQPGLVDDPKVILALRAHELRKVSPATLSTGQLLTGYQRAVSFGLQELAFEMLLERERRVDDQETFDRGHFEDLLERVLQTGDLALARRIRDHGGEDAWWWPKAIAFQFDLLENPQRYEDLERQCREAACAASDEESEWDEPLSRLAHEFAPRYPGLAITFARAAIASNPERQFDNEVLLDVIRDARVDLDLEPEGDPAEPLFDQIDDRAHRVADAQAEDREITRLRDKLTETFSALDERKQALREAEQALGLVGAELEKARAMRAPAPQTLGKPASSGEDQEATLRRLREQVASLKAQIGEQQAERRQLRKMLTQERRKLTVPAAPDPRAPEHLSEETGPDLQPAGRPMLPEYSDDFKKRLATLPPALAAKAIQAAGAFAALDLAIWHQTKPLERLPDHYRIRLGLDHRLMVQWKAGQVLRILDVIPRQDLESWIKRQR